MQEPYYWYILYVRTNTEARVMNDLTRFYARLSADYGFEPFCPESEVYYRGKADREKGRTYKNARCFRGTCLSTRKCQKRSFCASSACIFAARRTSSAF